MTAGPIVAIEQAAGVVPGLYDVVLADGSVKRDLTVWQCHYLAHRRGCHCALPGAGGGGQGAGTSGSEPPTTAQAREPKPHG